MSERDQRLDSLANCIADYREGEIPRPDVAHVDRWVRQFDADVQIGILREMEHVLKNTYFSSRRVDEFLISLLRAPKVVDGNPMTYWQRVKFLDIQKAGQSQHDLLSKFDFLLQQELGLSIAACGAPAERYVYLDDILFTGARMGNDLSSWLASAALASPTVEVIVIASHSFGEYKARDRLTREAHTSGRKLSIRIWRAIAIENRLAVKDQAEVLWPSILPSDPAVQSYATAQRFPFQPRTSGGKGTNGIFPGEAGRHLLEQQFLMKGMYIRSVSASPAPSFRPLGFGPFGLGFGSTIVTYRNCPNNAPLALWWGNADAPDYHPFSKWYPLLPRKTYSSEIDLADIDLSDILEQG